MTTIPSELAEGEYFELVESWSPIIVEFGREYGQLSVIAYTAGMTNKEVLNSYFEHEASADDLCKTMLANGAERKVK